MKPTLLSCLLAVLFVVSCAQTSGRDQDVSTITYTQDCVCGDPDGDLVGCYHESCFQGRNNPENPDCVCGGLTVVKTGMTHTSTGAEQPSKLLGASQILYLSTGKTVRGVLVSDDGISIELKTSSGAMNTYQYDDLDVRSVYRLKKGRAPMDNAEAQIEVGNYARDVGYYAHAKRHYQQAAKDDPSLEGRIDEELGELRRLASEAELASAKEAMSKGDMKTAEKHVATILKEFPDEAAAGSAGAMMQDIQTREATMSTSVKDTSSEVAKAYEPAERAYAKAVEYNRKGLLSSNKQSSALKSFSSALKQTERVQKEIASVLKKDGDDPAYNSAGTELGQRNVNLIVEVDLNMASIYMTRSSYQDALQSVNHALAVAPNNAEAKQTRARVELAASNDGWGGWGYGGGRRRR